MMVPKDYAAIATILKLSTNNPNGVGPDSRPVERMRQRIARDLALYFASTNPRFRPGQFLEASEVVLNNPAYMESQKPALTDCYCPLFETHGGKCNGPDCTCHLDSLADQLNQTTQVIKANSR